jgi:hypothetical protein
MVEQIKMFITKCGSCDDTGILYMWTRHLSKENKYTIPIYCECIEGIRKKTLNEKENNR